jgi:SAM-dependent methyltransferase
MRSSSGYSQESSNLSFVANIYGKRPNRLKLTSNIIEIANIQPGCELLEVGCGEGITAAFLADYLQAKVIGVDLESSILNSDGNRKEVVQKTPWLYFCMCDAASLPFRSGKFDCIWCESTLSTMEEKMIVVSEFRRLLKPGGRLIVLDFVLGKPIDMQLQNSISFLPCLGRTKTVQDYLSLFEISGFTSRIILDCSDEVKKSGYWLGRMFGSIEKFVCESASGQSDSASRTTPIESSLDLFLQFIKKSQLGYYIFVMSI